MLKIGRTMGWQMNECDLENMAAGPGRLRRRYFTIWISRIALVEGPRHAGIPFCADPYIYLWASVVGDTI
jgi:hypothetical protein